MNYKEFKDYFFPFNEFPQNVIGYFKSRLWKKRLVAFDSSTPEGFKELKYLYGLEELLSAQIGHKIKLYISDYYVHKADPILGKISGSSLGKYICLNNAHNIKTVKHERGHCHQSEKQGWFYLPISGLPSLFNNLRGRIVYNNMTSEEREKDYYSRWSEGYDKSKPKWWHKYTADWLGKVVRFWNQD